MASERKTMLESQEWIGGYTPFAVMNQSSFIIKSNKSENEWKKKSENAGFENENKSPNSAGKKSQIFFLSFC